MHDVSSAHKTCPYANSTCAQIALDNISAENGLLMALHALRMGCLLLGDLPGMETGQLVHVIVEDLGTRLV